MTIQDSDHTAAATASSLERLRPWIRRNTTSWPSTITAVLAPKAQPSRLGGTSPTSVAYAVKPASICA